VPGSSTCRPTHKSSLFIVVGGAFLLGERQRPFPLSPDRPPTLNKKVGPQMSQCRATTAKGERCTLPANGPEALCWSHDPKNAEKRRRIASKGLHVASGGGVMRSPVRGRVGRS
jgi:hypothetical protein